MRRSQIARTGAVALVLVLASAATAAAQEAEPAPEAISWFAQSTPIEGTLVGEHWIDTEAPGCDPGTSWRFGSEGTGQIAGVGEVDFVLTQCAVFDLEVGTGTFGDGAVTFTTADGDTLEIAQLGHGGIVPGPDGPIGWTYGAIWDAVGGTGRFEGASGYGWLAGVGDVGYDALYSFHGNLEYDMAESAE